MANSRRRKKAFTAFVIMPFNKSGSEDFNHFMSIYNDYIKPTVESIEGLSLRGDEITDSGSITVDLIDHLANDDVVIADLSDLNPNVFYELGIRHSLVGKGTILIMDESRTEKIPFDLNGYRVIEYRGDAKGLAHLKNQLKKFLEQFTTSSNREVKTDNPVHDWVAKKSSFKFTGGFNSNKEEQNEEKQEVKESIGDILEEAWDEAQNEMIPKIIISKAEDAVREDNLLDFIECVKTFVQLKTFEPVDIEYRDMYYLATRIDAGNKVIRAILEKGRENFPESVILITPFVSYLAHSTVKSDRQAAKEIVENYLRIKRDKREIKIEDISILGKNTHLLALMLDAYHRDGQHKEAFEITSSLVAQFPENTIARRNNARAMDKLGTFSMDEIISEYKKSVFVDMPGDFSALWYGGALQDDGRLIDALEAHFYACTLDLDEPECFARLSTVISDVVQPRNIWRVNKFSREIPDYINKEAVIKCIMLTVDCPGHGASHKFMCEQAMRNIGFGVEELEDRLHETGELTRTDRRNFVVPIYEKLKSEITDRNRNE